ncbi:MAG: hypothetical protein ABIH21_03205, partial [Patescibacteria group bacterium]
MDRLINRKTYLHSLLLVIFVVPFLFLGFASGASAADECLCKCSEFGVTKTQKTPDTQSCTASCGGSVISCEPITEDAQSDASKDEGPKCDCFCRTEKGIKQNGNTQITEPACREKCDSEGDVMSVCATSFADFPSSNPKCWTKDQCESYKTGEGSTDSGIFEEKQVSVCPEGMSYC